MGYYLLASLVPATAMRAFLLRPSGAALRSTSAAREATGGGVPSAGTPWCVGPSAYP